MKLKWAALIFLAFFFASCATVVPNNPLWGTSKEAYPILTSVDVLAASTRELGRFPISFYEVPFYNEIQLQTLGDVFAVTDTGGALDSLRGALIKYVEWKEQLKDTGGKVSKPIIEIDGFYPSENKPDVSYDFHSLRLDFETGSDGQYYLKVTEMISKYGQGHYYKPVPKGPDFLLSEDQVMTLSQAISQENILAKAKEADAVANQKAAEDAKNKALQKSLN